MFASSSGVIKAIFRYLVLLYCVCTASAENVEFTVFATADLHGKVGVLTESVAPIVSAARIQDPDGVIYVDVGDTCQGSFRLLQQRGRGMLQNLSQAGCTIWVPGNHDLEYGFEAFKAMTFEFEGCVLAANLHSPELSGRVESFRIVELNGVKVAFIGLMLPGMNNVFPVDEARFQTLPGKAVLRKSIDNARKAGAEVIILLRHAGKYGGGENLLELTGNMPEIDLVIGAHTHQAEAGSRMRNFWYVQPPAHGSGMLKVMVTYDRAKCQVRQMQSSLITLENRPESDPDEAAMLGKPAPVMNGNINLPAHKMRLYTKADLAVYAVASLDKLQVLAENKSPSVGDYFRVFPYFDPVVTVTVSEGEFKAILKEILAFAYRRKQILCVSNFEFKSSRGRLHNVSFAESKNVYKLALSAYTASGAGGQLPGVRRILRDKIDYTQAESSVGILEILLHSAR